MDHFIDHLFGKIEPEAVDEVPAEEAVDEVPAEEEEEEAAEEPAAAEEEEEQKEQEEAEPAVEEEQQTEQQQQDELKCDNCHSVLTDTGKWVADADNHTFCDEACSRSYVTDEPDQEEEEMMDERTCAHCCKTGMAKITEEKWFCNRTCEDCYLGQRMIDNLDLKATKIVSKCSQCNNPLGTKAIALGKGPGKFCSVQCSNRAYKIRIAKKQEEEEKQKKDDNMEDDAEEEEEKTELCKYCKKLVPDEFTCYCSKKCFDLDQIVKQCPNCDRIVTESGDEFCSLDCSLSYQKHRTCAGCGCNFSGKQFYCGSRFYCSFACCPGSTRATRGKSSGISSDRALMQDQLEKIVKTQIEQDERTFATKILEREYDGLRSNLMLEYRKIPDTDVGAKQKFILNVAGPKMKKSMEEFRKQKKVKQEQKQKQKEEEISKKRAEAQKKRIEAVKRKREQQQEKKSDKKQKQPVVAEKKESAEMILF